MEHLQSQFYMEDTSLADRYSPQPSVSIMSIGLPTATSIVHYHRESSRRAPAHAKILGYTSQQRQYPEHTFSGRPVIHTSHRYKNSRIANDPGAAERRGRGGGFQHPYQPPRRGR